MFNLPINIKPYYNTDQIANSIAANDMFDCYLEPVPELGYVTRRRPGLQLFADLDKPFAGDGLFYWDATQTVIAVCNGRVYCLMENGTSTDITGAALNPGIPVIFADGQALDGTPWLYMANGDLIYSINRANTVAPTDPNTPSATHVAWINSRFIANEEGTNRFDFTDTNLTTGLMQNDYWSAPDNPLTCEARGDRLHALFTAWQEIYAWGTEGLEVWQDDGSTPFSPLQGAFAEAGLEAVYSVARADNTIFALCVIEGKRCVIKLVGRQPTIVSEPIARVLCEMDTVSDAIGDIISVGGLAIYLLSFPAANQTWAYDYAHDTWCRWGYWNEFTAEHDRFIGQHSCFAKGWNKHLIMSRLDGKIYELDRNVFDDAGNKMVSYRRTGWIDHNNAWKRKRSTAMYIKVKCGSSDDALLMLRWRDDGRQEWSTFMDVPLSPVGHYDFMAKLNRMGMYRSRQYEFRLSDNADLVVVGATESIVELRN